VRRVEAANQLRAPTEPGQPTLLRRRAHPQHNLPLQLTRFIGRDHDLTQLRQLLDSERLLTLTGSGGIGKTRLAIEVAGAARDVFADGVWLVDLAPLAQAELVVQAVAEPLGVRAESDVPLERALLDFLHGRQLLLLLDNCEHLVAACARLAEAVLRSCPAVRILATSREPLHIPGETTRRVAPLTLPQPSQTEGVLESEAVRLFAERARAAAGLTVSAANVDAVARLCAQLDGIPLAIELAAARCRALSVEQIATRLSDRFRLLVGSDRTAPARQQTLRATLDWSYELLPPAERHLLNCLSVFAGGWTLDAAERIGASESVAPDEVFELLARLVDKSLVQAEPGSAGHLRYRLLESVRDYAHEQLLASGEASGVPRRHCAYYVQVAEQAEAQLLWGPGGLDWLAQLERELANLRAALAWSLSAAGEPAGGLALAAHLGHYWYTRGDRAEGRVWLKRALSRVPPDNPDEAVQAWALLWAGGLAHGQSDYDEAATLVGQALALFDRVGDQRGIGWGLSFLGHVARARAELPRAADYLEQAIAAFRAADDQVSLILPLAALGFTVGMLGDHVRAGDLLDESVSVARQMGAMGRLAIASIYLGQVACMQADTRRATAAFEEGIRQFHTWHSAWGMAECLEGLAVVAGLERRFERAAHLLGAAARLRQSIGAPVHPVDRADHERTVAASLAGLGEPDYEAAWQAGQAMSLDEVIARALSSDRRVAVDARRKSSPLTSREREVAALIARGLSNRQIAEVLVVAERTVTNHVEHIFDKLGFRSRAQVAAWVTEMKLQPE
jgi:predicted ATPase/DNA-binding CsgD family transcriptional regulator